MCLKSKNYIGILILCLKKKGIFNFSVMTWPGHLPGLRVKDLSTSLILIIDSKLF